MAFTLSKTRLRLTEAKFFGNPDAGGLAGLFVRADGSIPLTADWFAGNFSITSHNSVDVFNVVAYGADKTGAVDSTAPIQTAINDAQVNGGIVFFPGGLYACAGLTLLKFHGVTFKGTGYGLEGPQSQPATTFVGSTLKLNGPTGAAITTTTVQGSPVVTVTAGGPPNAGWVGYGITFSGMFGQQYIVQSVDVGLGTITLTTNYTPVGAAGVATTVVPRILTIMNGQQHTVEDLCFDGNMDVTSELLTIDSTNSPQVSRMVTINRVSCLKGHVGIRLNTSGVAATESDSVVIDRFYCAEQADATSVGVWVNSNNVTFLDCRSNVILGGQYAYLLGYAGPSTFRGCIGGLAGQTMFSLQGPYDSLMLDQCQCENGAGSFIEVLSVSNGNQPIQLRGCIIDKTIDVSFAAIFNSTGCVYDRNVNLNNHGSYFTSTADVFNAVSVIAGAADKVTYITSDGKVGIGMFPTQTLDILTPVGGGNGISIHDAHGGIRNFGQGSEDLVLSNAAVFTDTINNILPVDAIIKSVKWFIITAISGGGVTTMTIGDPTTPARFASTAILGAGTGGVGMLQFRGSVNTDAAGPTQFVPAKVRVTLDGIPTQGEIRLDVDYINFVAPTS